MNYGHHLLGLGTARTLQERAQESIIKIGNDGFTRGHLAKLDCFNFSSAKNSVLKLLLESELIGEPGNTRKPRNTRDLFYNVPPTRLAKPGIGSVTLAVLGALFEAKGLGGDDPLQAWVDHHKVEDVTFSTLKMRDERDRDEERKAMIAKKRAKTEAAKRRRDEAAEERKSNRILSRAARTLGPRRVVNG